MPPAKPNSKTGKTTVISLLLAACFLGSVFMSIGAAIESKPITTASGVFWIVAIVAGIIAGSGAAKKCPECHDWWATKFVEKKLAREEFVNKIVDRHDTMSGGGLILGVGGVSVGGGGGTRKRQEAAKVLRRHFDHHFKCIYCGHTWTTQSHEDTEEYVLPN